MVLHENLSSHLNPLSAIRLASVLAVSCSFAGEPETEDRSAELIEFDTTLRLSGAPATPTTDQAEGSEIPEPISLDADLVAAYRLVPEFRDDPTEFSFLTKSTDGPDAISIQFERQTALIDGGFGDPPSGDEAASSFYESQGERFDRYSLSLEWVPTGSDAELQWLLIGGLHAIRADIGRLDPENASLGLTEARGMVAIPTVGTGFRWSPTDALSFSTTAATQSIESDASMLEVVFSTQIHFTPLVDLTAGYEFYRSDMTVEDLRTSLDREGVFARLTIRF